MNKDEQAGKLFKFGILVQIPGSILYVISNSTLLLTIAGLTIVISFCLLEWAILIFLKENIKKQAKKPPAS